MEARSSDMGLRYPSKALFGRDEVLVGRPRVHCRPSTGPGVVAVGSQSDKGAETPGAVSTTGNRSTPSSTRGSWLTSHSSTRASPTASPMLYARIDDSVYVHGSTASRTIRTLASGAPACVTVTLIDGLVLARSAFEHSANYRSVVLLGEFRLVEEERRKLEAFEAFKTRSFPAAGRKFGPPMLASSRARPSWSSRSTRRRRKYESDLPATTIHRMPNYQRGPASCQ